MHARNADLYENKEAQLKDLEITFIAPDNKEAALLGETGMHGYRRPAMPRSAAAAVKSGS